MRAARAAATLLSLLIIACGSQPPAKPSSSSSSSSSLPPLVIAPMPASANADASAPPIATKKPKAPAKYEALVAVLDSSSRDRSDDDLRKTFAELRALSDPRATDALVRFLEKPGPLAARWKTQAGLALAELGDVRAVPTLAWRLKQDPLKLYDKEKDHDLRMDDSERVVSARYIADLLRLHPDRKDEIAKASEDSLLAWAIDKPQPHANALRALALMQSTKARPKIRAWSDPKEALPTAGQQSFPPAWATAQVAQRYLGSTWRDAPDTDPGRRDALALFRKQLTRRPEKVDASMDALLQGGAAVLGMTLRALAVGAVQGIVEANDTHAFDVLTKFIDDEKANEQARLEACSALGFVASSSELTTIATKKISGAAQLPMKQDVVRRCYFEALFRRGDQGVVRALLPLLQTKATDPALRVPLAMAIGATKLGPPSTPTMQALNALLGDLDLRVPAALAMLLGGDLPPRAAEDMCTRIDLLSDVGYLGMLDSTFGTIYDHEIDANGDHTLVRRLKNAIACGGNVQKVAERSLKNVSFDSGPRSVTRVVLRGRLIAMAKEPSKDPERRADATLILRALGEEATLDALGLSSE